MKVRPLYDNIIVKRLEAETTTLSGIIIPDNAKEKPSEGIVQAVGNGKVNDKGETLPLQVKEGDRVLFGKYSGSEIKINGEELLILSEDKILAVIEG